MLGVSIPLLRRVSWVESAFQRGLMSILNAFAGGVFLTLGAHRILPRAVLGSCKAHKDGSQGWPAN